MFDPTDNTALFSGPAGGALTMVAREGDTPPGLPAGVGFFRFHGESVNGAGDVAFRTDLSGTGITSMNNETLWTNAGGGLQLIAREGEVAPCLPTDDVAFDRFTTLFMRDDGQVCFFAYLRDAGATMAVHSGNDGSIWRFDSSTGDLHLIAREGDTANNTKLGGSTRPCLASTAAATRRDRLPRDADGRDR